jgi:hypothetical protein
MRWEIWTLLLFSLSFLLMWHYRYDFKKGKTKFILYTVTSCLAYPFGVFSFSYILAKWLKARDIVGTPDCSLDGYPWCFFGHSIFFIVLIFSFSVFSVLAWRDFLNKRLEPNLTTTGGLKSFFTDVYYSRNLIEKNWIALPLLLVFLMGIWAGII